MTGPGPLSYAGAICLAVALALVATLSVRPPKTKTPPPREPAPAPAKLAPPRPAATTARHHASGDDVPVPTDPFAALAWWRGLPDGEPKWQRAGAVAFELVVADPTAAVAELYASDPAAPSTEHLATHVVAAWTQLDPRAATTWIATLPEGRLRDRATLTAVTVWCHADAPAAANWIATLPDSRARAEGLARAVTQWTSADPDVAGRWVAALPPGDRGHATAAHVETLLVESPRAAAEWLAALPPSEQQFAFIERVVREWRVSNPSAAQTWLDRTSLPRDRREKLQTR